jgi:hypothetical protein
MADSEHLSHLKSLGPEGAKHASPGQRPGIGLFVKLQALKGRHNRVSPLQGLGVTCSSQPRALPWAFILLPLWGEESAYAIRMQYYADSNSIQSFDQHQIAGDDDSLKKAVCGQSRLSKSLQLPIL